MSTLNIMLEAERGGEPRFGISTRLTRVAAVDGTKAERAVTTEVAVSAGSAVPDAFEVQPGRYVVEALLPSGDTVVDFCVVPFEGAATVVLGREGSAPSPGPGARHGKPKGISATSRDFRWPSAGGMLDRVGGTGTALMRFRPGQRALSTAGGTLGRVTVLAQPVVTTFQITRYAEASQPIDVALTLMPGSRDDPTFRVARASGVGPGRSAWVRWTRDSFAYRAALPSPWVAALPSADRTEPASVAVSFPGDRPPQISVDDRAAGAMLAYLSSSRIDQASLALRDLERRGLAPGKSPGSRGGGRAFPRLGACYVAALGRSDPRRWTLAVRALQRLYPASADAAVLLGRMKLESARTEGDLVAARSLFVAAASMEPPAFMVGIQMLLDGLSVFADEDSEAAAARRAFLPIAAAVDTTQPFTVLAFRTDRS